MEPLRNSRSLGSASSMWLATRSIFSLITSAAPLTAPAIITVKRLPPGPDELKPLSESA